MLAISLIGFQVPFSFMYPHRPAHCLPPRVFCCVCFVHNFDSRIDKLSHKSIRCIFLGYPRHQKGYKCFHPPTSRLYISADVTFFESQPYYPRSPPSPTPIPLPILWVIPHHPTPSRNSLSLLSQINEDKSSSCC